LSTRWLIGSLRSLGMNDCSPQTHILVQQILSIGLAITLPFEPLRRAPVIEPLGQRAENARKTSVRSRGCRLPLPKGGDPLALGCRRGRS
jgi:hypothetical protein